MFILGNRLFSQRGAFLKKLVPVADSAAAAEAPKDLCYVHSAVNQSRMVRISLCCVLVGKVAIIRATVQYIYFHLSETFYFCIPNFV